MTNYEDISSVINRVATGEFTDADLAALQGILSSGNNQIELQLGKYNVNITEGKEIHIGDRIYNQWDEEAMKALVKAIQETNGIHQTTQSGDAAARDIDKRNIYENCTFIQVLTKDKNFENFPQDSLNNLDFSNIPHEIIQKAYQDVLPPDARLWDLEENNITQILQSLNEFKRFDFLTQLSQDKNISEEIRNQLSDLANQIASKKYPENNKNIDTKDFFYNKERELESYLIATIEHCDDDNEQFLLNAWLIIDDSVPINDLSRFTSLLDKNEQQVGTLCKFSDIPKKLNKFIKTGLRYLRGKQYKLIVEIFLPSDLIGVEIDRWKISDPIIEETSLGIKYPIRLRSLERLNLEYLDSYLSDWYKYWDKVKTVLHNEPIQELFEHLEEMESFNWKLLRNSLKEKIGLKLTCAPPKAKTKDLFRAILTTTTPIAIWTRYDIPNLDQVSAIDEILTFKPLCHLCESVRETREQADAQTEEHLGFHLALLWENPYRLTPDIMLELTTVGQ
ncbi:MAG: hypothetical protein VKN72_19465 [Nostocales cyanobacterium 94392]|nr:hypothetical protein [Nostocales cyanobacterium 94392]